MANILDELDQGIDLSFDEIYQMNENFEERSYLVREEEFNAASMFYHSVLSSIEKVYGRRSYSHAKNIVTTVLANRMEEVGRWILTIGDDVCNKQILNYLGLSIEEVVGLANVDEDAIIKDWMEEYSEESNFEDVLIKMCNLFGREEERDFALTFAELTGSTKQRVKYFVMERIRVGEKAWEGIIWRGTLKRQLYVKEYMMRNAICINESDV
jgi:hypothetical protein